MPLSTGTRLGPYEIIAAAGAGGMGEVYRARDARLDRTVAIKVLPENFAVDAGRLKRFEQESRSVAALNHPNILAVYDVSLDHGMPYLVTEYLEGKTLRERLNEGALPMSKAVDCAQQIARGLAAAHERGIVHRDLKPENIFLTRDGHAKLLDFGLAKPLAGVADATMGSTTSPGVVLGTAGYMAPEQVRGESVDQRADIFSFGAVLYEMLGGKRAFSGDTSVEVMTAILKSEPPEFDPAVKISPGLDRIVRHCLEKNAADRFQTARDLTFALGALSGTDSSTSQKAVPAASRNRGVLWIAVALACVALAIVALVLKSPHGPVRRMQFAMPVEGEVAYFAISPDGEMLAYVSPDENTGIGILYVQHIGDAAPTRLDGTEEATYPFFSPDHNFVAFFANGHLKKMPISGGVPQILAKTTSARGGSWGSKDVIIYAPEAGGPIWRINPDGTQSAAITEIVPNSSDDASHRFPIFLPDGEHFLFWSGNFNEQPNDKYSGIYLTALSSPKNKKLIALCRSSAGYSNGFTYYIDDQNALRALPMDAAGNAKGESKIISGKVGRYPSTYLGAFSVSTAGTVIFGLGTGAPLSQLTWFDRTGKEVGKVGDPGILANPSLSPDNTAVAVDIIDLKSKNIDVWIESVEHGTMSRFTFDPAEETNAVWSPDGSTIAYRNAGFQRVMARKARGVDPARQVLSRNTATVDTIPTDWSRDGKTIVVSSQPNSGGAIVELVGIDGRITPFLNGPANQTNGQISPDGKWMLYASNESGEWEIYATPFPSASGKVQISRGGGTEPRWNRNGKEIFYLGPKNMLTAISVTEESGALSTGTPQTLFQLDGRAPISSTDLFTYDVAKDGQRFLVNRYLKPASVPPLNIILNEAEAAR